MRFTKAIVCLAHRGAVCSVVQLVGQTTTEPAPAKGKESTGAVTSASSGDGVGGLHNGGVVTVSDHLGMVYELPL